MARPSLITGDNLRPLLLSGPTSATQMAASLRVNRTTVVRALPDLGENVVTLGATRSSRYVLRRNVRNTGNRWPIYQINDAGQAKEWAELEAFHERYWRISWAGSSPDWATHFVRPDGLWTGFPFFLADVRPQGFLGRAVARQISSQLQLPEDPTRWSDDDTLIFLHAASEDLPGNLVVGDECLRRALARPFREPAMADAEWLSYYPQRAEQAANVLPGSSAGGEQPKFLATVQNPAGSSRSVLVKFSPNTEQPVGRRWADLLLCEFYALEVLAGAGLAVPGNRILDSENRRFLEITRFDRVHHLGASGRRGVVSLAALQASALDSYPRSWPEAALQLLEGGWIQPDALHTVRRLHAFGELIGNTDMHLGNLACWLEQTLPLRVAPIYDMLPMLWAPTNQGELVERTFAPLPPLPAAITEWRESAALAENFWERVRADERLSVDFSRRAGDCLNVVKNLRRHVA